MRCKGLHYEKIALDYLSKKGLKLADRNFHCKQGEVDLIMFDKETLVFVEVRFRGHNSLSSPAESVSRRKQHKIIQSANHYLSKKRLWDMNCRFDVIAITQDKHKETKLEWLKAAFDATE